MSLFRRRFTTRGAAPGTLVAPSLTVEPIVRTIAFDSTDFEQREGLTLDELAAIPLDAGVTWIDVQGLGDGQLVERIGQHLGLHQLAISDIVNLGQRPKIEEYGEGLFVVLSMATVCATGRLQWEQVSLFVREHCVVTFQEAHGDCLQPLRERIRGGRGLLRTSGSGYLACMVIDAIVDGFFPVLEQHGERLERIEDEILQGRSNDILGELYLTKRDLAAFRRAIWPLREALSQMIRNDPIQLSSSDHLHLRDTLDHTMQAVEVNESYRELAASLIDVHLSMVGQKTNDVMRVLTVISAIFIPLTFVAGVYGMNFDTSSRFNLPELRWEYGYLFFWGLCLALAMTLFVLFRRLGWLSR